MISAIVAVMSFVTIIVTTSIIVAKGADIKKIYDNKLRTMTDQINNSQYYNSKVDQENNQNINDVRKTYTSKDELSRSVDTNKLYSKSSVTNDLQANSVVGDVLKMKKTSSDQMRADKLVSAGSVVGQLDASILNASSINLTGDTMGKGSINFGSTVTGANKSDFLLQRGIGDMKNNVVMSMPKNSSFNMPGDSSINMNPTSGEMSFSNKWSIGKNINKRFDNAKINYDSMSMNFDNNEVVGLYNIHDGNQKGMIVNGILGVNTKDDSMFVLGADDEDVDPVFIATNKHGKGIGSFGDKPFTIHSKSFQTGSINTDQDSTNINDVNFSSELNDSTNIHNDKVINKKLMIYGNSEDDGKTRRIGMADKVDIHGDLVSQEWTSGQNVLGRDHVTAGEWAAWMRNDGTIQGNTIKSKGDVSGASMVYAGNKMAWLQNDGTIQGESIVSRGNVTGQDVFGDSMVYAGNKAAFMKSNGSIHGESITSMGDIGGRNVYGNDMVYAGDKAAGLGSDGRMYAKMGTIENEMIVGAASMKKDGSIIGKNLKVNSINSQTGLNIQTGPFRLNKDVQFGADDSAGVANNRFIVRPDGNVGVGIATPVAKLHVSGSTRFDGPVSMNNNNVGIGTLTPSSKLHVVGGPSQFDGDVNINQNNRMSLGIRFTVLPQANGGNVGVGTATPASKLHVAGGNSQFDGNVIINGNMQYNQNNTLSFGPRLTVTPQINGGYVGIGTAAPAAKLHVVGGNAQFDGNVSVNQNNTMTLGPRFTVTPQTSGGNVGVGTATPAAKFHVVGGNSQFDGNVSINQNNVMSLGPRFTVMPQTNGGNVGVGTATPSSKLHVVGNSLLNGSLTANSISSAGSITGGSFNTGGAVSAGGLIKGNQLCINTTCLSESDMINIKKLSTIS